MHNTRSTKILVECPELIASVRVGVLEPLKDLAEQGLIEIKFKRTIEIKRQDIAWCDILICVRGCEYVTRKIVESAKKAGRFIVYFLDDDLLNIPSNLSCSEYFNDPVLKDNIKIILRKSDVLWTVSTMIREKYKQYCNGDSIISKVPSKYINFEHNKKKEKVKILYAGSESHSELVKKQLSPVLLKLCEEYKEKIDITFLGVNPRINSIKNIRYFKPFENYDEYKDFVLKGNFDIGLAVIDTNEFYQCKYYNKFIEYTSIGCVGIYTNTKPYTDVIIHYENGLLCDNTFDNWYTCIKFLIDNEQLRNKCLNSAVNKINTEFSYKDISTKLIEDMPEVVNYQAPNIGYKQIKLNNTGTAFIIERIKYLWRSYKLLSIPIIMYKACRKLFKILIKDMKVKK